jgi:hypothetical protein
MTTANTGYSLVVNTQDVEVGNTETIVMNISVAGYRLFSFIISNSSNSANALASYKVYISPDNLHFVQKTSGVITTAPGNTTFVSLGTSVPASNISTNYLRLTLTSAGTSMVSIGINGE